jgi:hypothetical protein
MNARYPLLALALGVLGFGAIEAAGALAGYRPGLGPSLALDASAYALSALVVALLMRGAYARARGARAVLPIVLSMLLFAPLTALLAGVADLTLMGGWGVESLVRGAFIATPVNLILTLTLELGFVALPLGALSQWMLWRTARMEAKRWA